MPLRDWVAPATLATVATLPVDSPPTVATVATVAIDDRSKESATVAEVATVAVADSPTKGPASVAAPANRATTAELRELIAIISADWPDDERADALAAALADLAGALVCFRAHLDRKSVV